MDNQIKEQIINLLKEYRSNLDNDRIKSACITAGEFLKLYNDINDAVDVIEVEKYTLCYAGVNGAGSNKKKIESKIQDCNMALYEYERYKTDNVFQDLYNRFGADILKHDMAFEIYLKRLIKYNSNEKNLLPVIFDKNVYDYFNVKQMKLSRILKDFKLKRTSFIEKVK